MESFEIRRTDAGIHVEGFPDAVKLIRLDGQKAKRLSDLALHRADLDLASECLHTINRISEEPAVLRQALWRCAIIHFMKCFGDPGARFQLSVDRIYKGEPPGLIAFEYFRQLRNKHFVHDENSYAQSIAGAVLNRGDKGYKIGKILCLSATAETLEQDNYNNLSLLVSKAKSWVTAEFDSLCESLTRDLEVESYDALARRESVIYKKPDINEISKKRGVP